MWVRGGSNGTAIANSIDGEDPSHAEHRSSRLGRQALVVCKSLKAPCSGTYRRKKPVTIRFLSLLCALTLFMSPLYAQQSYREFERELNLSDYQKAQVAAIKRKYMNEWRALNDESARKRLQLRQMDRDRPDRRERAERLRRDLGQIEASRQRLFHSYRGEISTVFNSEQRGQFNRFTEEENRRAARPVDSRPRRQSYAR